MTADYATFDAASYLDSDETIAEYLTACAEDENPDVLLAALADVAKARGMANVAKAAGLGRESLYKTLAPGAHPRFETIRAVLRALNVNVSLVVKTTPSVKPAKAKPRAAKAVAPWKGFHAAGPGFAAHGPRHARTMAKKSAAKRSAKKGAAKR